MSPTTEKTFLRKLWITLISVVGPFIIVGVINLAIMIPNVKANTRAIDKFGEGYISRDEMMRYFKGQENLYEALVKGYDDNRTLNIEEHQIINAEINALMKDVYKIKLRGK